MKDIKKMIGKFIAVSLVVGVVLTSVAGAITYESRNGYIYYDKMIEASNLANEARANGCGEDSEEIKSYSAIWWENYGYFLYEVDIFAVAISVEAGNCTDQHVKDMAGVTYNRILSPVWKVSNVYEALTAPRQYSKSYVDPNSDVTKKAKTSGNWEYCKEIATMALKGEIDIPKNVVYQSNSKQGKVYSKYYIFGNWTYICHGRA